MNPEEQRIRVVRFYSQQSRCYHNLKSSNSIFSKTTHRTDLKQKPKLILVARRRRCQKRISFIFDVCGRNSRKNEIFNTSDRFSRYLRIGPTKKLYQKLTSPLENIRFYWVPFIRSPLDAIAILKFQTRFSQKRGIGPTQKMHFIKSGHVLHPTTKGFSFIPSQFEMQARKSCTDARTHKKINKNGDRKLS